MNVCGLLQSGPISANSSQVGQSWAKEVAMRTIFVSIGFAACLQAGSISITANCTDLDGTVVHGTNQCRIFHPGNSFPGIPGSISVQASSVYGAPAESGFSFSASVGSEAFVSS